MGDAASRTIRTIAPGFSPGKTWERYDRRGFHSIVLDVLKHDRMGRDVRDTYVRDAYLGLRPRLVWSGPLALNDRMRLWPLTIERAFGP